MPYIYKITNLINQKIYIGKTVQSLSKRFSEHCSERVRSPKRPLYAAMNKYGIENFSIDLLEEVDQERVNEREIYWIETLQSFKYGYNASLGGEGTPYLDYDLIVATFDQLGTVIATANKLKIGQDTVSRIVKQYNRSIPQGGVRNSKTVLMFDLQDNFIQAFPSTRAAARFLIETQNLSSENEGGYAGHIGNVCKGKRKTCQGFKWKYGTV